MVKIVQMIKMRVFNENCANANIQQIHKENLMKNPCVLAKTQKCSNQSSIFSHKKSFKIHPSHRPPRHLNFNVRKLNFTPT
jgi:formyltetrahydrofolate synthetase